MNIPMKFYETFYEKLIIILIISSIYGTYGCWRKETVDHIDFSTQLVLNLSTPKRFKAYLYSDCKDGRRTTNHSTLQI